MNSITDHAASVTVRCKCCSTEIESHFVRSPDRAYVKQALESMKRLVRQVYPEASVEAVFEVID